MKKILEVNGLNGGYLPNKPIIRDLTFAVCPGEMAGLIGLNGAGKSTTIKHILGLLPPQRGEIRVAGRTLAEGTERYRSAYAYVPEAPELYEEMTIREHLRLTAMVYGLDESSFRERTARLGEQFQMSDKLDSFPQQLSKGMKQKVMIMSAFLVEPPLYIIDEPFLGLDPLSMRTLLELMVERKRKGAGFLISSHILSTIEAYCDRYVVLHKGRIAAKGTLSELRQSAGVPNGSLEQVFFSILEGQNE